LNCLEVEGGGSSKVVAAASKELEAMTVMVKPHLALLPSASVAV